jgi:hypothetical protein
MIAEQVAHNDVSIASMATPCLGQDALSHR